MNHERLFTFIYVLNIIMLSINLYLSYKYDSNEEEEKDDASSSEDSSLK
ncbi:hypothetical protein [Clostridium sp.]